MGTDIHFYIERREDEYWQAIGDWVKNDMYEEGDPELQKLYFESPIHVFRNYAVFSVLADVRNDKHWLGRFYALLGINKKPLGYIPISSPRGLPEDLSSDLRKQAEKDAEFAHNPGWLSIQEILEYDWDKPVDVYTNTGLIETAARKECEEFITQIIPQILKYGKPEYLRCVFWFDN